MDRKERQRIAKRDYMRRQRAIPDSRERINALRRLHRDRYVVRQREYHRKNRETRIFYWRSRLFNAHYKTKYTAKDFAHIWKQQRGLCALTGERLTIGNCHLDHKLPITRGGTHELSNLRWVTERVNRGKHNLTDSEFILLCNSVAEWIGRRIVAYEKG